MLYFKGGTFTHKSKGSTHSKRGLTHLTLNTQILKNAEKKRNNTQIKINKFVYLKVKKHLLNTQNVSLKHHGLSVNASRKALYLLTPSY